MNTWNTVDKSEWPRGAWDDEPDKAQWIESGLDCLIVRGPRGALCGYVGVPESHRHFGKDYEAVGVEVHGGLTFADRCRPTGDESKGICHAGEVANKTVWWLGFDCGHAWDIAPTSSWTFDDESTYKGFAYVKSQVASLAGQLAAIL